MASVLALALALATIVVVVICCGAGGISYLWWFRDDVDMGSDTGGAKEPFLALRRYTSARSLTLPRVATTVRPVLFSNRRRGCAAIGGVGGGGDGAAEGLLA